MHIRKIVSPTLRSAQDRQWAFLGALEAKGYPLDRFEFYFSDGKHASDYGGNEGLMRAAQADGFGIFDHILRGWSSEEMERVGGGRLGYAWSCAAILREIIDAGGSDPTMFVLDDLRMRLDWCDLEPFLRRFEHEAPEWRLLQMFHLRLDKAPYENRYAVPALNNYGVRVNRGLLGHGEHCMLVKPSAARTLLENLMTGGWTMEMVMWTLRDEPEFYSTHENMVEGLLWGRLSQNSD